jgi:hypothetical protein
MNLTPKEMDKITYLWEFHRKGCNHMADAKLEHLDGGGIGKGVHLTCGCGKVIDVTDYLSW